MAVFKKANGHIFGVQFSSKEQKAIDAEILRQCAEYDKKNADEVDALVKRYEMGDEDKAWLCSRKLRDYGIDISEWNKEEKK
jgi:hypothetical protein